MTNREEFLAVIRANLPAALLPGAPAAHPGPFQGYDDSAAVAPSALVVSFRRELEALSGHVYRASTAESAAAIILQILQAHQTNRLLGWDEPGWPGLTERLEAAGVRWVDGTLPTEVSERQRRLEQLDPVRVGLTGVHGGLADTGAIALISGPERGRLASLLPPVHIAILPAKKLYPSLPAFLAANPAAVTQGSNLVFIAGPSRTGDIEMTLSMGVHGPGEVHVIVMQN